MQFLPGKFVWFEHVSNDVAMARRFYDGLFGWRSDAVDMGGGNTYHMILNGADGIGGFRAAPPDVPNHWLSYLSVADVDATCTRAAGAGARVLMPPTDFPPVGRGACFADPTGAVLSIWKSAEGDRADRSPVPVGDWCWNELLTADPQRALAFYTDVFGYTDEAMDMGEAGSYHLLKIGNVPRAGLMHTPMPETPAHWLPYVAVFDVDATAERAEGLDARIVAPPREIPGIGRFAVLLDPLHAAVAIYRPATPG